MREFGLLLLLLLLLLCRVTTTTHVLRDAPIKQRVDRLLLVVVKQVKSSQHQIMIKSHGMNEAALQRFHAGMRSVGHIALQRMELPPTGPWLRTF